MSKIQVGSEENEISASMAKGYLESVGIKASIGPSNENLSRGGGVANILYGIYVEESDAEEAKKMLKERV